MLCSETESVFASNLFSAGSLWECHKPIACRMISLNKQDVLQTTDSLMALLFQVRGDEGIKSQFNMKHTFLYQEATNQRAEIQLPVQKSQSPVGRVRCQGTEMPVSVSGLISFRGFGEVYHHSSGGMPPQDRNECPAVLGEFLVSKKSSPKSKLSCGLHTLSVFGVSVSPCRSCFSTCSSVSPSEGSQQLGCRLLIT